MEDSPSGVIEQENRECLLESRIQLELYGKLIRDTKT